MNWVISRAIGKAIKNVAKVVISWVMAQNLSRVGVTVDPIVATPAMVGFLEMLRNYLKVKLGVKWL